MSRDLSTSMQNVSTSVQIRPLILVEAEFDSDTVRLWSGRGDLQWNSHTWAGAGNLLNISPIHETSELRADGAAIQLSGIPQSLLSLALQEDYQGRTLRIYLGAFTDAGEVISSPVVMFSGRMDVMTIDETGGTSVINISVENRLIDFERTRTRRYTSEDQKIDYPNDKGLEFVTSIQEVEIAWGRV